MQQVNEDGQTLTGLEVEEEKEKKRKVEEMESREEAKSEEARNEEEEVLSKDRNYMMIKIDEESESASIPDAGAQEVGNLIGADGPEVVASVESVLTTTIDEKSGTKAKRKKAKTASRKKKVTIHPAEEEQDTEEQEVSGFQEQQGQEGQETEFIAGEEGDEEEEDDKLYCICKAKFYDDEVRSMLACDSCDEWYHASCMNINEEKVKFVDQFICLLCEPNTHQRTTMRQSCSRNECDGIAPWPLSNYCCQECGILVAANRVANMKQTKGISMQKMADKILQVPRIKSAKKIEGNTVWISGQDKKAWLESILGHEATQKDVIEDVSKLSDLSELEELIRLQKKHKEVEEKKNAINQGLDALAGRTTLLQMVEDRVSSLDLIREEEGESNRSNIKKSKNKKAKQEIDDDNDMPAIRQGQIRCGYDERLSWNDERFQSWYQTDEAKQMLDLKNIPLDGSLFIEGEESTHEGIKICGQSKRKCKRHADWSSIRGADMDSEKQLQSSLYNALAEDEQAISKRIEELKLVIKDKIHQQEQREKERDVLLAMQLATQGTRRAIQIL